MNWKNYGDVNPIEHGGMWIEYDEEIKDISPRCYYVVRINKDQDEEELWHLDNLYIDLNDDWIEWGSVYSYADTGKSSSDIDKAIALAYYYGSENFGTSETIEGEESVKQRLKELEINFE